jgi:glyoxylase-like metal-dependent hydrolase (beta-lactamase superfamily II)
MPCDYSKYPANWQALRQTVLDRACHRCEACGVRNHVSGVRCADGSFFAYGDGAEEALARGNGRVIRIVLTIAHLDHDLAHNDLENLRALCQRCHNRLDRHHRAANAARTRDRKRGQMALLATTATAEENRQ